MLCEGFILWYFLGSSSKGTSLAFDLAHNPPKLEKWGVFRPYQISGFDNPLSTQALTEELCQSSAHSGAIQVQKSFFIYDDKFAIAESLDSHPYVDYPVRIVKGNATSLTNLVARSWDILATSCVFLATKKVYLCVTRILFHPGRNKTHARISFLRGRIMSEDWEHLPGYVMNWPGVEKPIVFPKNFDVDADYEIGGLWYGPEDPRIILEDVPGAEPVIVFNMISAQAQWRRAMFILRPFSQSSTILTIADMEREKKEKNWAPLFLSDIRRKSPSTYIYFVWWFAPLKVLRCQLQTGLCDVVFEQRVSEDLNTVTSLGNATYASADLRGGTQFLPIPRPAGTSSTTNIQAFLSIPRHHVDHEGCRPGYRPEFAVLVTDGTGFYFSYISAPLDFGRDTVMTTAALLDTCVAGRIMIVNSIARWDIGIEVESQKSDLMTLTMSVNDETVQVLRLAGLYSLLQSLPSLANYFSPVSASDQPEFEVVSTGGWKIRTCVEKEALRYTELGMNLRAKDPDVSADWVS